MRGAGLILLVFLVTGMLHYSRWAFPEREELPAVVRLQPHFAIVGVADSRGGYGLYQFDDASKLIDVIKLTEGLLAARQLREKFSGQPIFPGEIIKVTELKGKIFKVERSWLSARHRMLLQIPLHPDRMTPLDWETLPGVGPKLATAIESDRQKNGDFIEFSALTRVKGVGIKKLELWHKYFIEKTD